MSSKIEFTSKKQSIALLTEMFNKWNDKLAILTDNQASNLSFHANRSIKDDVSHLWLWQRISNARMEAAVTNKSPNLDWWPKKFDPESETDLIKINDWIYQSNKDKPWSNVYNDWKDGFLRLINLANQINENDLLNTSKFPWLKGYPLIAVLFGSYDHHREHFEKLTSDKRE